MVKKSCIFTTIQPTFLEFAKDPKFLEDRLRASLRGGGIVFIDEVHIVNSVLNTIQYIIDSRRGYQFVLTGSSSRKLRRGKANLLPGRVHSYEKGPITAKELDYQFRAKRRRDFLKYWRIHFW